MAALKFPYMMFARGLCQSSDSGKMGFSAEASTSKNTGKQEAKMAMEEITIGLDPT